MENVLSEVVSIAILAFYLAVLAYGFRGGKTVLLALNVFTALLVGGYVYFTELRYAPVDVNFLSVAVFEVFALAFTVWAFRGNRFAVIVSYATFVAHVFLAAFNVYFAFFFHITRII